MLADSMIPLLRPGNRPAGTGLVFVGIVVMRFGFVTVVSTFKALRNRRGAAG